MIELTVPTANMYESVPLDEYDELVWPAALSSCASVANSQQGQHFEPLPDCGSANDNVTKDDRMITLMFDLQWKSVLD